MRRGESSLDTTVFFGAFVFWAAILLWSAPVRADPILCYDNIGGYISCANGGTCLNNATIDAECNCTTSLYWEGDDCTVSIDDCPIEPEDFCCARGTCADQTGGYTCNCAGQRYNGSLCDNPIAICPDAYGVCSPPATCISSLNSSIPYTCNCSNEVGPAGPVFNGEFCHLSIAYCTVLDPCVPENSVGCQSLAGDYVCECIPGWTGKNCDVETDECNPDPCGPNSLACDDRHLNYTCHCKQGWDGRNCTHNIDDCIGVDCPTGTFCFDQVTTYQCATPGPCPLIDICEHNTGCQEFNATNGTTIGHNCDCSRFRPDVFGGAEFITPYNDGQLCQNDVDSCELYEELNYLSPCPGGRECFDRNGGFVCAIAVSDGHCENGVQLELLYTYNTDVPDTLSIGADCTCSIGWHGVNCTLDDDECLFDPCDVGETCVNALGTYFCVSMAGPCPGNPPCENDGTCEPYFAINGTEVAHNCDCSSVPDWIENIALPRCQCILGYTGVNCSVNIDDCENVTCSSHGTCVDGLNDFVCDCADGYIGAECESNPDNCTVNSCNGHGTCHDGLNTFTCECDPGFVGPTCGTNVGDCYVGYCENDGTCVDGENDATCDCKPGSSGNNCEIAANECTSNPTGNMCAKTHRPCFESINSFDQYKGYFCGKNATDSNPCQHGSTPFWQYNATNGFVGSLCRFLPGSDCPGGWTGPLCGDDADECISNVCGDNAFNCTNDVPGTFTCHCNPGWTGQTCDTEIHECEPNPCQHDGICSEDGFGAASCCCVGGWEGTTCTQNHDDCTVGFCLNNGTCVDGIQSKTCNCSGTGWAGTRCHVRELLYASSCMPLAPAGANTHAERAPRTLFQVINEPIEEELCIDVIAPQRAFDTLRTIVLYEYDVIVPGFPVGNRTGEPVRREATDYTFLSLGDEQLTRPPDNRLDDLRIETICRLIGTTRESAKLYVKAFDDEVMACFMFTKLDLLPNLLTSPPE